MHCIRPLTTTYRHDYLLPNVERYEISKQRRISLTPGAPKVKCDLHSSHAGKKPEIEWTRNHVTEHILSPRFIPKIKVEKPVNMCLIEKPNKYLVKNGKFPHYLPAGHKRCCDTFRTTYQLDFPEPNQNGVRFNHRHYSHGKKKRSHATHVGVGITDPCSNLFSKLEHHNGSKTS